MKTKSLLLAALVFSVALISAHAQTNPVYSVNAVGYVNRTIHPGFELVANPLVATTNTIASLFGTVPVGTQIYKFSDSFKSTVFFGGNNWFGALPSTTAVAPGEGVFVGNNSGSTFTITFVGEVLQGSLTNPVPTGFSIVSSQVPQAGRIVTDLGAPIVTGDTVYIFSNATGYTTRAFLGTGWFPVNVEPTVQVGDAFWIFKSGAGQNWVRVFSVNN